MIIDIPLIKEDAKRGWELDKKYMKLEYQWREEGKSEQEIEKLLKDEYDKLSLQDRRKYTNYKQHSLPILNNFLKLSAKYL